MDIWKLKKGTTIRLESGSIASVLAPTSDGRWIRVRYLEAPSDPKLEGTEDLCANDEILGLAERPLTAPRD